MRLRRTVLPRVPMLLGRRSAIAASFAMGTLVGQGVTFGHTRSLAVPVQDFENVTRTALANEARFNGLRRVQNLITGSSDDLNAAGWSKDNSGAGSAVPVVTSAYAPGPPALGTRVASRVVLSSGATASAYSRIYQNRFGPSAVHTDSRTVWMRSTDGVSSYAVRFRDGNASTNSSVNVTVTGAWQRFNVQSTTAASILAGFEIMLWQDAQPTSQTADLLIIGAQAENTTGQSNLNPGEDVSVGVLSTPWHGAGVDGVKYFTKLNGNTVAANVVTEGAGAALPGAVPVYLLNEPAATNLILRNETFNTGWVVDSSTVAVDSVAAPDGNMTADGIVPSAGTVACGYRQDNIPTAAVSYAYSTYVKNGTLGSNWVRLSSLGGANAWFDLSTGTKGSISGAATDSAIEALPNGWYRVTLVCPFTATATSSVYLYAAPANASSGSITGDGVKPAFYAWRPQLETGTRATSSIATTTVAVTRPADLLQCSSSALAGAAGSVVVKSVPLGPIPAGSRCVSGQTSGTGVVYFPNPTAISVFDGTTSSANQTITPTVGASMTVGAAWDASGMRTATAGVAGTLTAFDGDEGVGTTLTFFRNSDGSSSSCAFGIADVGFNTATPATLAAATA